jgi:hypothetical protein
VKVRPFALGARRVGLGFALAVMSACAPPDADAPPTPASGPAAAASLDAPALAASVAAAGSVAPPEPRADAAAFVDTQVTPATRKARFDARAPASLPDALPAPWRKRLAGLDGKVTSLTYERHAAYEKAPPFEALELEVRFFGLDADNDARMHRLLRAADLPDVPDAGLPDGEVDAEGVVWKATRHPSIAPPGEPREIRYTLSVLREPPPVKAGASCRGVRGIAVPGRTPAWLAPLVRAGSTRKLVGARDHRAEEGRNDVLRLFMLFQLGESADEATGQFARAAAQAGYRQESGAGSNRQVWRGQNGERFSLRPSGEDLRLGCRLDGPLTVLEIESERR